MEINQATNTNFPPPPLANNGGIDSFIQEMKEPAKDAVDTPTQQPQPQGDNSGPAFSDEPLKPKPEPVFSAPQPEPEEPKQASDKEAKDQTDFFLLCRNILQAELLAFIANSKNPKEYELSDDQLDKLARVWVPYVKKWGNKIPDWLWLVMVEAVTTGKLIARAFKEGMTTRRNEKNKNNPAVADAIAKAAAAKPASGTRTNFTLKKDGTYKFDANGIYVKKEDPKETADIKDLAELLEKNSVDLVCEVFKIDTDFIRAKGINLEEE